MNDQSSVSRIIWAVDALHVDDDCHLRALASLKQLLASAPASVQPVFVYHPDLSELTSGTEIDDLAPRQQAAEESLRRAVASAQLPGLLAPVMLTEMGATLTAAARSLAEYAVESRATLIVLGTHARTGFSRFISGSFADVLLTESTIPVLVIGPKVEARPVRAIAA